MHKNADQIMSASFQRLLPVLLVNSTHAVVLCGCHRPGLPLITHHGPSHLPRLHDAFLPQGLSTFIPTAGKVLDTPRPSTHG